MTIEEIDKKGYAVKVMKRATMPKRGIYYIVVLEKNKKLYVAWRPDGHTEYTTPFYFSTVKRFNVTNIKL